MNRYALILAIALLSTLAASAQGVYRIKLRGSLISPTGHTRIKETDLVATNGHFLTFEVDIAGKDFDLDEMFANGTPFREQIHSHETGVGADGRTVTFMIHNTAGFADNVAGLPAFGDYMLVTGRVTERSLRFSVVGIWDDPNNIVFKGVITGKRILP